MEFPTNFSPVDWMIVLVYLLGTVGIGLYANRFVHDMADYLVAGRNLRSYISIATMLGSEIGLVTVMYTAQKGFSAGFAAFHIGLVAGLACLFVGLTGFMVVPLRRTGVMTIPEYYGQRFGQDVRVLGALIMFLGGVLNMGVFLKAGAIFITSITGMNDPSTVNWVMTALIALVLLYTVLGGMISVVITDYVQFVVLAFGMLVTCFLAWRNLGWGQMVEACRDVYGAAGFDPLATDGFGLTYVAWMFFTFGLISCAVWPTAVMRICSAADTVVVHRFLTWSSIGFVTRVVLPQFLGIAALTYYWNGRGAPDNPFFLSDGTPVSQADTLAAMPLYLGQLLPVGILGLIVAAMLAAFMSTHDSYILCWASVFVEDVVNPLTGNQLSLRARLLFTRVMVVAVGMFLLAWSILFKMEQDMIDYLAVSGAIYFTGAFALLLFGLYWKRASRIGALLALLAGTTAVIGLTPVRQTLGLTNERLGFTLHEGHIGLATTSFAMFTMVVGSLLFPDRHQPPTPPEMVARNH